MPISPRVSVVLPVRNGAATIGRALASLREQTLAAWEAVLVDDGSTDGTWESLQAAAREEPRFRVVERAPEGIVAALNAGLAVATGPCIARMDADDTMHPERLALQEAALQQHPELGLVSCLVRFGGDRERAAGYALHVDWVNSLFSADEIALNRFIESPFAHPSVMFRRDLVERHGGYRSGDFPEDYEMWLRWLDAGVRMGKVPHELLTWEDLPTRLSRTDPRYSPEAFFRIKALFIAAEVQRTNARVGKRPVYVWGAGRPTRKRAAALEQHGLTISGYVDVDLKKIGNTVAGRPVIGPDELPPPGDLFVLGYVSTRGARDFNRKQLLARGYQEGRDFLMCA